MSVQEKGLAIAILLFLISACSGPYLRTDQVKGVYHRIKAGETLWGIARAYGTDVLDLAVTNYIDDPDYIEAGGIIFVPNADRVIEDTRTAVREPPAREEKRTQVRVEPLPPSPPMMTPDAETPRAAPASSPKDRVEVASLPRGETAAMPAPPGRSEAPVKPARVGEALPQKPMEKPPGRDEAEPVSKPKIQEAESTEKATSDEPFMWPVQGKVTSRFGNQPNGMYFNGIDIIGSEGTPVMAAAKGRVTFSAFLKDYGETIIIQHDGHYATVYAHLGRRMVRVKDQIEKGEQIALLGKTEKKGEAYLNFGIWYKNKARNPLPLLP
ncbi:MAG: peptidoglycan DD-metalloendopeptidase family protein [Deltaproteobacteria bacterium]|nr:peptidoglycan DD-metalloendopeptidase family protein [Deltaproteobacteria bacterium]